MTSTQSRRTPTVGDKSDSADVTEEAVVQFLNNHNDFLLRHGELLEQLEVGHPTEGACSLIERQVTALRKHNEELRERLGTLISNARSNDRIFGRMRALTLALMDANDEDGLEKALAASLVTGFEADDARCFVADWTPKRPNRHLAGVQGEPPIKAMFQLREPACGAYRSAEYRAIFPGGALEGPCSIALVPLPASGMRATLVIGAIDPNRFTPDMGTMFLHHLGEVLGRRLQQVLGQR